MINCYEVLLSTSTRAPTTRRVRSACSCATMRAARCARAGCCCAPSCAPRRQGIPYVLNVCSYSTPLLPPDTVSPDCLPIVHKYTTADAALLVAAQSLRYVLIGPELYRQTGTFVDTESEIRAKRLPDCLPIGGSQIDPAFLKRIFDFRNAKSKGRANHFD